MSASTHQDEDGWRTDAAHALAVLAVDPHGMGGIWLHGRRGGAMEQWLAAAQDLFAALAVPLRRVPLSISDGRLLGGLDLASTLAQGRPVAERGVLSEADGGVVVIPNIQSQRALSVAAVCSALDQARTVLERDGLHMEQDARFGVIAIHESSEPCAPALFERLALVLHFGGAGALGAVVPDVDAVRAARARVFSVSAGPEMIESLCAAAFALGAGTVRIPLLALRVARAAAALAGRTQVEAEDAAFAMRLVIAPRATRLPAEPEDAQGDEPPPPPPDQADEGERELSAQEQKALEEMLIAAAVASLPPAVLETLKQPKCAGRNAAGAGRSGAKQKSRLHGRRSRSCRGDPREGAPLDVLETIRAAAPWQKLRRLELGAAGTADAGRAQRHVEVRRQDFRVRTFKTPRETATIFAVDASGSSALNRLAEAKGAIELLLADCYSRRDHVALIAFRGKSAELLLPPTRSLARVKRSLAALPGGGGTPLASAIDCAVALGDLVRRKGQTPTIVFLTDGKANVDRAGNGSRERGEADVLDAAHAFKAAGLSALVIDTSPRSSPQSRRFAAEMDASYLPLPYANAQALSDAVRGQVKPLAKTG
jgi:magnesium chelatase subunit D